MADLPGPEFPRILRRVWRLSDRSTRSSRHSNALDRPAIHQRFSTIRGDYWVCAETGQMVRDRFPDRAEELSGLYDGWWRELIAKGPPPPPEVEASKRFLARFDRYRQGSRLFEVGSGRGKLLKAARERGWQASGNELSEVAAEAARQFSGAEVAPGPIEAVELEPGAYDLVILNNVFEHLSDPRAVLLKLSAALRRGGALYLQTLDGASLSLLLNPRGWTHFIDGHLYVPTLTSLRHYLEAAGLRPVELETHGFSSKTGIKREKSSWPRRRADKLVATLAARFTLGHRVRMICEKGERVIQEPAARN
jgi:2-polyprenyl-3-methyl-5-hydroxy-6-metoxy-1,4-benzoquinol methylase